MVADEKSIGGSIMRKPLPDALNDIVGLIEKAETAADRAEAAAQEAKEAVKSAIEDLMVGTINPLAEDLKKLAKVLNENFAKAEEALKAHEDATAAVKRAAMDSAMSAQEARDAYAKLQAEHNDLVDKYNGQDALLAKAIEATNKHDQMLSDIMTGNINNAAKSNEFYRNLYAKYGIQTKAKEPVTQPK